MQIVTALTLYIKASTVSGMCLAASNMSWILQTEPSPTLLQGSMVKLHPFAHAQFAQFELRPETKTKKGCIR